MEDSKRILDSVHGYIKIDKVIFKDFIDTVYFQRLRRIEQTSTRALFPSARHDRFIHSLGVYHLGLLIIKTLRDGGDYDTYPANKEVVFSSYEIACLLHDVGHSPFSHTFENYFENEKHNLSKMLEKEINNETFNKDSLASFKQTASHERMSAYVALKVFRDKIVNHGADVELVVRMIIGCKYQDVANKSFENAMIDLIHGEIIDSDGLDYVKRDSWASGYSTAKVDSERLISAIRVHKNAEGNWMVCYSPKALNEIEAVLAVKTYQQKNVITHHTVVFEQNLLVKAMESAALYHFDIPFTEDEGVRRDALEQLCDVDAYLAALVLPKKEIPFVYPEDDDFISLMKYVKDDKYVSQWLSRQYKYVPLWKSTAEFFTLFPELHRFNYTSNCWLFSNRCRKFISEYMGIPLSDIWSLPATGSDKGAKASKVSFLINDKIIPYKEIYSNDKNSFEPQTKPFNYIYVPKILSKEQRLDLIKQLQEKVSEQHFD